MYVWERLHVPARDGGVQAVRAAGENLQIRTLSKNKTFLYDKFRDFLTIWWKAPFWLVENQKRWKFRGRARAAARARVRCTTNTSIF
jgi:hypothetical protein